MKAADLSTGKLVRCTRRGGLANKTFYKGDICIVTQVGPGFVILDNKNNSRDMFKASDGDYLNHFEEFIPAYVGVDLSSKSDTTVIIQGLPDNYRFVRAAFEVGPSEEFKNIRVEGVFPEESTMNEARFLDLLGKHKLSIEEIERELKSHLPHVHTELMSLYNKGAEVQVYDSVLGWNDCNSPIWVAHLEYRIKPVDPFAELKAAHAEGKVIQVFSSLEEWGDITWGKPFFDSPLDQYRIKPEPESVQLARKVRKNYQHYSSMANDLAELVIKEHDS